MVGTTTGTVTNLNGGFTLSVPSGKTQLEVSYIGMVTKTVKAGANLRIELSAEDNALDEVMVVAYGTQKKSSFTGSAAEVKSDKIEGHIASNATNALAGTTAGVQFTSSNGDPASNSATIRIRGFGSISASNAPLYIVDGMPYEGLISNINPQDIASMTVLKDAAASAIYGARGANGVILITTKKGKSGDAEIKFDAKFGTNSRAIPNYDVVTDPGQYYELQFRRMYNAQVLAGTDAASAISLRAITSITRTMAVSVIRYSLFQRVRTLSVQTSRSTLTLLSAIQMVSTTISQTTGTTRLITTHSVRSTWQVQVARQSV